jgi:hypothetical protein
MDDCTQHSDNMAGFHRTGGDISSAVDITVALSPNLCFLHPATVAGLVDMLPFGPVHLMRWAMISHELSWPKSWE